MAEDQYRPYKAVNRWVMPSFSSGKNGSWSGVEGSLEWDVQTVAKESGLETTLCFAPSHRGLKEFVGRWLIQGVVFFHKRSSDVLLKTEFTCNQANPVHTFESTLLDKKDIRMIFQYTQLVGMGVVPRPNYNIPTDMTDVCLVVGDKRLHLSKTVLASLSDYFKVMFSGNFLESKKNEVEIKDVDGAFFIALLDLCFGSYLICEEDVERLLEYADRFVMPCALQKLETFLLVTDITQLEYSQLLLLADRYNLTVLLARVVSELSVTEKRKLLKSPIIHRLSSEAMVALMKKADSL